MVTTTDIKNWIESRLNKAQADVTGDGRHFEAIVICDDFSDKNTLERHRMVYEALGDKMKSEIHALSLRTLTAKEARQT